MNKIKTVVAALIEKDNQYLIARRATGACDVLGKWEFPGGKLEEDESEFQAIEREIFEEFEMKVKAKCFLVNNICEYPAMTIDLRLYACEYQSGTFKLHDHFEYRFVPKQEMKNYDFCKADIPLVDFIIRNPEF